MAATRPFSTISCSKYYDVVIVGGGMIGSVLARSLAHNGILSDLSILVLESAKRKNWLPGAAYSNRVSALNASTKHLFKCTGLWDTICSARCRPVTSMKVWGNGSDKLVTTFTSREHSDPGEDLAYIVENDVITDTAFKSLEEFGDRVKVLYGSSVTDVNLPSKNNSEMVKISLQDGSSYECSLLIGADGANSKVRKTMGVQYLSWNYNQQAVVGTLGLNEDSTNETAWQKFIETGPIALLPLSNNFSSLVWTTTPKHCSHLLSLSDEEFVDVLNTALWKPPESSPLVDGVSSVFNRTLKQFLPNNVEEIASPPTIRSVVPGSRASFPLGFGHAVHYIGPRVVLVGDAAHRVHPLAGQGVNLGFGDISCLTDLLADDMASGSILGNESLLREYETLRQRCNVPKMLAIDVIQKIAGKPWPPTLLLTNTAIQLTNAFPPLKKFLVSQAAV